MVLNLLSTRTLPECEDFLSRSFLHFQATAGARAATIAAQQLKQQAVQVEQQAAALPDSSSEAHSLEKCKVRL
jgi:ubiquinone biosynthesis protein UbiJ